MSDRPPIPKQIWSRPGDVREVYRVGVGVTWLRPNLARQPGQHGLRTCSLRHWAKWVKGATRRLDLERRGDV